MVATAIVEGGWGAWRVPAETGLLCLETAFCVTQHHVEKGESLTSWTLCGTRNPKEPLKQL